MKPGIRLMVLLALAAQAASAQTSYTYVQSPSGGNTFALGFPVPVPESSTTPFEGFRTWQALHARHQDLMLMHEFIDGEVVGQTRLGRDIWAYALSSPDPDTPNGGRKSSVLINGGIHAREWGTPELTTGLIEGYAEGAGDGWLYDYLLDHVRFTVLPVNNIDGFLQTQRYPTEVLVGDDPRNDRWPRDGRMRRKNHLGADENLSTTGDHLSGVDLNRNSPPFFDPGGWTDVAADLTYHGPFAQSEPETRALVAAAAFADQNRLRWYQDTHSFTQLFFSVRTSNDRRNALQTALLSTYSRFHDALSQERNGIGRLYQDSPDAPNTGIGTTSEYFAHNFQIPSWTLEIEPMNGAVDYGGLGANHDGFILPEAEVSRLRDDMAITHAAVAYRMAGPPSVQRVEITTADGRWPVMTARWTWAGNGQRTLDHRIWEPMLAGVEYRLRVVFDKPMRWLDDEGSVRQAPGHSTFLEPLIWFGTATSSTFAIDTESGRWLDLDSGAQRYATDSFEVNFTWPEALDPGEALALSHGLVINTADFTGQLLDTDPATAVDWINGAWSGYQNSQGQTGDFGGSDTTLSVLTTTRDLARIWLRRRG